MRLVVGISLITNAIEKFQTGQSMELATLNLLAVGDGVLFVAGLWTPVAGAMVAFLELWKALSQPVDPWTHILLGTLGAALAMIGPGAWSVDAGLFGWKRIDIPTRER